jgi:4-hydroxy-tetrahydrodipicolinate synthase
MMRFDQDWLYADPEPYLFQRPSHRPILGYRRAYRRNDRDAAMCLSQTLEPLRRVYERWIITPLRSGRPMNAALKAWCAHMGLAAGTVREPTAPLTREEKRSFDAELDAAFEAVFDGNPPAESSAVANA